jgi:CBS domain-containing protein
MTVSQIMQSSVATVTPDTSARSAAALMAGGDIGMLPVCENGRPIGVVTDRDIVLRVMPRIGASTDIAVAEIMSQPVLDCRMDDSIGHIAGIMGDHQIRRLIVRDDTGALVGVVSLGDIARDASEIIAGEILGEIAEVR